MWYFAIYFGNSVFLVYDHFGPSFRSETISDLPACCAHVTAFIIRTFLPCFPDQMPFLLLFLQPISRICSSTFSSNFVHPVPLISYYFLYVSFSICLFSFFLSLSFFVLCASTTTTHVKVIPISNLLYK